MHYEPTSCSTGCNAALTGICLLLACCLNLQAQGLPEDTGNWFPFQADGDYSGSILDMSHWLDAPAGHRGILQMNGDRFVFEDGTPVKFWGVNIADRRSFPDEEKADNWAEYLAVHGVNAVRFHKFTWALTETEETSTEVNDELFDRLDYFKSVLREKGIYYAWSHIFAHRPRPGDRGRLYSYEDIENIDSRAGFLNHSTYGLVNFATDLQDLHTELTLNMLNRVNPYTGIRYMDDPALAYVELQNEDNMFFAAMEGALREAPNYRALLNRKFSEWLLDKYGSHEAFEQAWGPENIEDEEHLDRKNIYPRPNHGWFTHEYRQAEEQNSPVPPHVLDRALFLYDIQIDFYERFVDALREAGYRGPIVTSCWQAGEGLTHYLNLHADYKFGFIDRHNYFGGGTGHGLQPGDVNNEPMVSRPGSGLLSTGMQAVSDRPFAFSEWMSNLPNQWIAEAPPIIAIYGMGLQGWDKSYVYASNWPNITETLQAPGHGVYNADSPLHMTTYPTLARMIYRGDIEEGEIISSRNIYLPKLMEGEVGFSETVKQDHDIKLFDGDIPQEALAAGRVVVSFTDEPIETEKPVLDPYWDRGNNIIRSNTGQLEWNYAGKGFFTVNSGGTKGVVGFAGGIEHDLGSIQISTDNEFAVILMTAIEKNESIEQAERVLITTIARGKNSGMKYNEDGSELLEVGEAPVLMEPVTFNLAITNRNRPILHVLDHSGNRTGQTIPPDENGAYRIYGSETTTIYYELEFNSE
ncbi:MAG: hypothetical protein EA359_02540 [Balneolaceae bacterium]|nr:MAG: hypothetical protein EA359_02540 [Balneolaceae bacterium]